MGKNFTFVATQNQTGKIGTSYSFSSQNCRTPADDSTGLNNANYISVSMWIYSTASPSYGTLITRTADSSSHNQFWFGLIGGNKLSFSTDNNTDKDQTTTFSQNTWVHVGVTFDAVNDSVNLYVNGRPVNHFGGAAISPLLALTTALRIGSDGSNNFAGKIDEVGIWHRKLSAAEMLEVYNSGNGKTYPF